MLLGIELIVGHARIIKFDVSGVPCVIDMKVTFLTALTGQLNMVFYANGKIIPESKLSTSH
jgi:hypothetical protein